MNEQQFTDFINEEAKEEDCITIISLCAMKLGWLLCIEEGEEYVRGLTVGTEEYVNKYFNGDK